MARYYNLIYKVKRTLICVLINLFLGFIAFHNRFVPNKELLFSLSNLRW